MSEFDDVIEREARKEVSEKLEEGEIDNSASQTTRKETPSISLSSLLEDEPLLSDLTGNINPELKNQVLIPLLNIVEKYGLADNLVASERTQTSLALVGVLTDVAPVIKGLSDYLEGHKNSLNESDKEFLQSLKGMESSDDLEGLFNADEEIVVESVGAAHPLLGTLPEIDISSGKVDWMEIMDPEGLHSGDKRITQDYTIDDELVINREESPIPKITLPSIDELAAEAGVDLENVETPLPPPHSEQIITSGEISNDSLTPANIDEFLDYEESSIEDNVPRPPSVHRELPSEPRPVVNAFSLSEEMSSDTPLEEE